MILPDAVPRLVVELLALVGCAALLALAAGGLCALAGRDKSLAWAVRYACPGCARVVAGPGEEAR